jgi:hypothetical protein
MEAPKVPQTNNDPGILASMTNAVSNTIGAANNNPIATTAPLATAPSLGAPSLANPQGATLADNTMASINNVKANFANMTSGNDSIFYLIIIVFLVTVILGYVLYYIITDNILFQQKETAFLKNKQESKSIIKQNKMHNLKLIN